MLFFWSVVDVVDILFDFVVMFGMFVEGVFVMFGDVFYMWLLVVLFVVLYVVGFFDEVV